MRVVVDQHDDCHCGDGDRDEGEPAGKGVECLRGARTTLEQRNGCHNGGGDDDAQVEQDDRPENGGIVREFARKWLLGCGAREGGEVARDDEQGQPGGKVAVTREPSRPGKGGRRTKGPASQGRASAQQKQRQVQREDMRVDQVVRPDNVLGHHVGRVSAGGDGEDRGVRGATAPDEDSCDEAPWGDE